MITPDSLIRFLAELKRQDAAAKTQNEYTAAAKNFCNWCTRSRRLAGNPLASVVKTSRGEKTYERRALSAEEAKRLLAVSGSRSLVYLTAIRTGLRRSELKKLQWGDLCIDPAEKTPRIALRAETTKSNRGDIVPLRSDVADALRSARPSDALPTEKVFSSIPKMATFKSDLLKADIPHIDASGRVMDFHGLQYTCGTLLAAAGIAPRVAMEIMRHTDIRLTMQLYTAPFILDTARAIEKTSDLGGTPKPKNEAARKTGTDDWPVDNLPFKIDEQSIAQKDVPVRPKQSISVHSGQAERAKNPIKQGFSDGGGGDRTRVP